MTEHEIIVSGMTQDPHGKWVGEARMVFEDEVNSAERAYAEAGKRYEADPDGAAREEQAIGGVAMKNSGDLFFIPPSNDPEADPANDFGVHVEASDKGTIDPEAGYSGQSH